LVIEVLNKYHIFDAKLPKVIAKCKETAQNVPEVGFAIIKIIMARTHMHP